MNSGKAERLVFKIFVTLMKTNNMLRTLFGILSFALLFSCTSQQASEKGTISGVITGAEGETIALIRFENNRPVTMDTTVIAPDGSFKLKPDQALTLDYYQIKIDKERDLVFITDSTEALSLTAASPDLNETVAYSGSEHSALYNAFTSTIRPIEKRLIELKKVTKDPNSSDIDRSQAFSEIVDLNKKKEEAAKAFIEKNTTSPAAIAALSELNLKQNMDTYKKVLDATKPSFGQSYYHRMVTTQYNQAQAVQRNPSMRKNSTYTAGMEAPNIEMADPEGNVRSLSDLRGKVVMIDFWASWCGPCRRENPNVVAAYNRYNDKGFEIFSVSLDSDKNKWLKAIQQDGLLWPNHVSDLKGWQNAASQKYGVSSIPHTILVGRDGKIIATHLRGAALEQKLAELF